MRLLLQLLLMLAACTCQAASAAADDDRGQRDVLHDAREEMWHIATAIIEDGQQPSRICNTRPQRVLPSIGFKPHRLSARYPWNTINNKKPLIPLCTYGKTVALRAPFRMVASRDYFVIALRHIVR